MKFGVIMAFGCLLGGCACPTVSGKRRSWTPAESGGVCDAYIRVPESSGGMAFVLAAPGSDVGGVVCAGAIQLASSGPSREMLWKLEGSDQGERLGWSMVRVPDIDGDGWDEVAVGSPGAEAAGMYERGCVRLVSGRSGEVIWRADGRAAFDQIGTSVTRLADQNGDGVDDVLASAPGEAYERTNWNGCVVVLSGRTGERLWQADVAEGSQAPGRSVCAADDCDGDGQEDAVVGVSSSREYGCIQIFGSRSGAIVRRIDGQAKDGKFGTAVARTSDIDGDGVRDLLVSAPGEGEGGVIHLLSGANGIELRTLHGNRGEYLGTAMYEVPDCDGDDQQEIGARYDGKDAWQVRVLSGDSLDVVGEFAHRRLN